MSFATRIFLIFYQVQKYVTVKFAFLSDYQYIYKEQL